MTLPFWKIESLKVQNVSASFVLGTSLVQKRSLGSSDKIVLLKYSI